MLHVQHLMCRFVVAFTGEEIATPYRHVASVQRRTVKLSIDRSEHALARKLAAIAHGDLCQVWRMRCRVRVRAWPARTA
jgi:hypothetical protein